MAPVGRYSTGLCRIWVQILLICTRTERDTECYGRTELDLRDPTTPAWAMGPVAHARNVGPRSDHYRTTRGGVTPRLCRIDSKIQSSSAREADTICTLLNMILLRVSHIDGGYGSCTKRASRVRHYCGPHWPLIDCFVSFMGANPADLHLYRARYRVLRPNGARSR